jgi:hypothetical protein
MVLFIHSNSSLGDMEMQDILGMVGFCLLALAGASGIALFSKATFAPDDNEKRMGTLWGLFWGGLIVGLILIGGVRGCH